MPVIGFLATISSLAIACLGLPAQIWLNWRRHSTQGLSSPLIFAILFTYSLWTLYGWTKPDYFIAIAQTPGCLLSIILIGQIIYYRGRRGSDE